MISDELLEFLGEKYVNLPRQEKKLFMRFVDFVEFHISFHGYTFH